MWTRRTRTGRRVRTPAGGRTDARARAPRPTAMLSRNVRNALTIDVEDWFHGAMPLTRMVERWDEWESRCGKPTRMLLRLLRDAGVRATFYVVGYTAQRDPGLVEAIAADGHEIGTHGQIHQSAYEFDRDGFRRDLERSLLILEAILKRPVECHRAANASITRDSLWALDVLLDCGIRHDSSVFPVKNFLYGIPDARRDPHRLAAPSGRTIAELPLTATRVLGRNLPAAGGFWLRSTPYAWHARVIRRRNEEGLPAVTYLHPWEFSRDLPRDVPIGPHWRFYQFFNTGRAITRKVERLLEDFRWTTAGEVLRRAGVFEPSEEASEAAGTAGRGT